MVFWKRRLHLRKRMHQCSGESQGRKKRASENERERASERPREEGVRGAEKYSLKNRDIWQQIPLFFLSPSEQAYLLDRIQLKCLPE